MNLLSALSGSLAALLVYFGVRLRVRREVSALGADYSVSVRLLDLAGQQVCKTDGQNPGIGSYPTSRWVANEVVADYYELQLPPDLPPGPYHWIVVVYRSLPDGGWENLRVEETGTEFAPGGVIEVTLR